MILLGITGLHAAGKSYMLQRVPKEFGFTVYNKKEVIADICELVTGDRENWSDWYKKEFNDNPAKMTFRILSRLQGDKVILDAVHSHREWQLIKQVNPAALLLNVTTPQQVRDTREEPGDKIKNIQRIKYWHSVYGDTFGCLLSEVDWSFNGAAPLESQKQSFRDLMHFINGRKYRNHAKLIEQGVNTL